ncbi:M20 family metallopeptidase [Leucobacter aridicollis]|uniref:Succinyl-diaminopimelate desuccinylase n=1 Tax=Leucobacter aridicollis TaxID=283878 RepID=A0A852R3A7_9MICO|nr:M20 family metallopeptidase [Leucobacter aridicollis]MBL3680916.1 M20 family peptidase [Leucobacter aridicollis]NYD28081.1 succinyl-diaminopimelate desuccinylase [Leucobacter aridicollis]
MIDFDRVVVDTQKLISIDSQNPGPLEAECADWVTERLRGIGLKPVRMEVEPGRDNVMVTVPGVDPLAPRLVILGHMDTVPIGEGWTYPPLGGVIDDDRIYGRGACDMKAGLALGIGLVEALVQTNTTPRSDVVLIATVDEEAPGMLGAHQLVADGIVRADDQVLAPEPTGMRLRQRQMGLRWAKLIVHGRMAHAGRAHLGIDANHVLAKIVDRLKTTFTALPFEDEILGRSRFTCGTIHGGVATNVVPGRAEAELDLRIVPPLVPEDAVDMLTRTAAQTIAEHPGARFDVELLGARRPPVGAHDDSQIIRGLRAAYAQHAGKQPVVGGADGHEAYTDASMVAALTGSESCTVMGPGATDQAHTADEFVPLADIELGSKLLWSLVQDW